MGLVLGLLYAIGAVNLFGQLRAEGLKPEDILPLIPLEQLLGRGITALIENSPYILLLLVITALAEPSVSRATESDEPKPRPDPKTKKKEQRRPYIAGGLFALLIVIGTEPAQMLALAISFGLAGLVFWQLLGRVPDWSPLVAYLIANIVALFAIVFAASILLPEPLPAATLTLSSEQSADGRLVAITGSGDYLVAEDDEGVTSFPSNRVVAAAITSEDRTPKRSLIDLIFQRDAP